MQFYQESIKKEFINNYLDNLNHWSWFLTYISDFELELDKDLFDFTKKDLRVWLTSRKLSSVSITNYLIYIKAYQQWAAGKGFIKDEDISAAKFTDEEIKEMSVEKKEIQSVDVIYDVVGKSGGTGLFPSVQNPQDQLLVYLIFLGAASRGVDVLLELRKTHVDFDNKKILLSEIDPSYEDISLDDFGIDLIKKSLSVDIYYRYLSYSSQSVSNSSYRELVASDYLFRPARVGLRDESEGGIKRATLFRRLKFLSDFLGINLTVKTIELAGILYVTKSLVDAGYKIDRDEKVSEKSLYHRFGVDTKIDNQTYRFKHRIKNSIDDVYPGYADRV